jgi:peptidylprolyl isomerase
MGTRKRDRFFALFGAILFLVTSSALTILVVWTVAHQKNTSDTAANNQPPQTACQDTTTEPTFPTPAAYKPTGPVTALQITDLTVGSGAAAKNGDCLVMKYYGTLASNGSEFDENYTKTTAFAFTLGQHQVISGWDQGLVGMKVGGERRLVIPASLAYGSQSPDPSTIPENSALGFDVKLLRIQ